MIYLPKSKIARQKGARVNWSPPITRGLVQCYHGGLVAGTTMYPAVGSGGGSGATGKSGTLQTGSGIGSGRFGDCLSFNGASTSFIDLGSGILAGLNQSSFSCWFYPNANADTYLYGESSLGVLNFGIGLLSSNVIRFLTFASGFHLRDGTTTIVLGRWHHVVVTYSSTAGAMIYLDGILELVSADTSGSTAGTANTSLGCYYNGAVLGNFNGNIDIVGMWNRVLQPAEALQLFLNPLVMLGVQIRRNMPKIGGSSRSYGLVL